MILLNLEKFYLKTAKNYVKRAKDFNISAREPIGYAERLYKHVKNCIEEGE